MALRNFMAVAEAVARSKGVLEREERAALPLELGFDRLVSFDEVPFLLLGEQGLQLSCPGENLRITAHGRIELQGVTWHRFYLSDERSLLQIGVDPRGELLPGELRLFQDFDQVTPGSDAEWGFWLDDGDGYIGYPEFQTSDQRQVYQRVWQAGSGRVAPLNFQEQLHMGPPVRRSFPVYHSAMLYGRHLAPPPGSRSAPSTEFMLVGAVKQEREAWIEIQVGMELERGYLRIT